MQLCVWVRCRLWSSCVAAHSLQVLPDSITITEAQAISLTSTNDSSASAFVAQTSVAFTVQAATTAFAVDSTAARRRRHLMQDDTAAHNGELLADRAVDRQQHPSRRMLQSRSLAQTASSSVTDRSQATGSSASLSTSTALVLALQLKLQLLQNAFEGVVVCNSTLISLDFFGGSRLPDDLSTNCSAGSTASASAPARRLLADQRAGHCRHLRAEGSLSSETVHNPAEQLLDWDIVGLTGERSTHMAAGGAFSSSSGMLEGHVTRHLLQSDSFSSQLNYFLRQVSLLPGAPPLAADEHRPWMHHVPQQATVTSSSHLPSNAFSGPEPASRLCIPVLPVDKLNFHCAPT